MIEQMTIFYHETQGDSMDEKQGSHLCRSGKFM